MDNFEKLYKKIIDESSLSITFPELIYFVEKLGFEGRCKGDHHIYRMDGVSELLNLQPQGDSAKKYQIKQVRRIVIKYKLGGECDDE